MVCEVLVDHIEKKRGKVKITERGKNWAEKLSGFEFSDKRKLQALIRDNDFTVSLTERGLTWGETATVKRILGMVDAVWVEEKKTHYLTTAGDIRSLNDEELFILGYEKPSSCLGWGGVEVLRILFGRAEGENTKGDNWEI